MKINQNDIILSMRENSPDAEIPKQFENSLKSRILHKKKNIFVAALSTRFAMFSVSMVFVAIMIVLGSAGDNFKKPNPSDSPVLDIVGEYEETESDSKLYGFLNSIGRLREKSISPSLDSESDSLGDSMNYYQQGNLKGGEVNDNKDYDEFLKYVKEQNFYKNSYAKYSQRFLIDVEDNDGKPVRGINMSITDNIGRKFKVTTDSDGEIYFFPNVYSYIGDNQQNNNNDTEIRYTVKLGGESFSFRETEKVWAINLGGKVRENQSINLDLAFIIDTTGSMGDQINKLKETIDSISSDVKDIDGNVNIRYGMVVYRDKQDDYLTKTYDFTDDLSEFKSDLNKIQAGGGGDYPEDVNSALEDAIEDLDWAQDSVKLSFLVADAPPHMDYGQKYDYQAAMLRALEKGIKIFPLASSGLDNTVGELIFREIAITTNANYIFITRSNGGTDYHVSENQYSVSSLDDLIVDIIEKEIK